MNCFLAKLGVPSVWEINDVYRLDPELLMMLPQPVFALMLLFPITEKYYEYQKEQEAAISTQTVSSKRFYMIAGQFPGMLMASFMTHWF